MSAERATILEKAIRIEALLASLGGNGRGIHEKLTSIEQQLDQNMIKKIRRVASIRNKAAHEINFNTDMASFQRIANEVIDCLELKVAAKQKRHNSQHSSSQNTKGDNKSWENMDWKERTVLIAGGAFVVGMILLGSSR